VPPVQKLAQVAPVQLGVDNFLKLRVCPLFYLGYNKAKQFNKLSLSACFSALA